MGWLPLPYLTTHKFPPYGGEYPSTFSHKPGIDLIPWNPHCFRVMSKEALFMHLSSKKSSLPIHYLSNLDFVWDFQWAGVLTFLCPYPSIQREFRFEGRVKTMTMVYVRTPTPTPTPAGAAGNPSMEVMSSSLFYRYVT
jgi:hypothetical protein